MTQEGGGDSLQLFAPPCQLSTLPSGRNDCATEASGECELPEGATTMPEADREQRLDEVLTAYLEAQECGWAPAREHLLACYPQLADDLERFFSTEARVERVAAPWRICCRIRGGKPSVQRPRWSCQRPRVGHRQRWVRGRYGGGRRASRPAKWRGRGQV